MNEVNRTKLAADLKTVVQDTKDLLKIEAADRAIRTHPYQSLGIGVAVGALIGFLLGRRRQ